jgi:hypothetical protein
LRRPGQRGAARTARTAALAKRTAVAWKLGMKAVFRQIGSVTSRAGRGDGVERVGRGGRRGLGRPASSAPSCGERPGGLDELARVATRLPHDARAARSRCELGVPRRGKDPSPAYRRRSRDRARRIPMRTGRFARLTRVLCGIRGSGGQRGGAMPALDRSRVEVGKADSRAGDRCGRSGEAHGRTAARGKRHATAAALKVHGPCRPRGLGATKFTRLVDFGMDHPSYTHLPWVSTHLLTGSSAELLDRLMSGRDQRSRPASGRSPQVAGAWVSEP